ncbi:MAG: AI-2E family transporter [Chloroflexota bacterium]
MNSFSGGARFALAFYGVGIGLVVLYLIRDVITLLFLAWIIAAALRPAVDRLQRWMPRGVAILIPYLLLIGSVAALVFLIVPPFVAEFRSLAGNLPRYVEQAQSTMTVLDEWMRSHGVPSPLGEQAAQWARGLEQAAGFLIRLPLAAFSFILGTFATVAIGFYWLLARDQSVDWICRTCRPKNPEGARRVIDQAELQMGSYVRGLVFLGVVIGVVTLIGLLVLRVPYAVVFAVIAGIFELLPTIGPIISAIPAILAALTISPVLALGVALLYLAVQQLENYILVPRVHEQSVGLPPLVILLAVLIGSTIGGITGAILAVPVAALIALVVDEWQQLSRDEHQRSEASPAAKADASTPAPD